jgi:hypothetical protein
VLHAFILAEKVFTIHTFHSAIEQPYHIHCISGFHIHTYKTVNIPLNFRHACRTPLSLTNHFLYILHSLMYLSLLSFSIDKCCTFLTFISIFTTALVPLYCSGDLFTSTNDVNDGKAEDDEEDDELLDEDAVFDLLVSPFGSPFVLTELAVA